MERIIAIEGEFKLILFNMEPFGLDKARERAIRLLSSGKILSIYFNINSGSQKVLDIMKRRYDIDTVMEILKAIRESNPAILFRTEFISGHPGETWSDFGKTISLMRDFRFDLVDVNNYSARPGIPALELDHQVSVPVRCLRYLLLWAWVALKVFLPKLRPF